MTTIEKIGVIAFLGTIITVYGMETCFLISYAIRKFKRQSKPFPFSNKFTIVLHSLAIIGILCFLYGYFIEPYWIQVNTFAIKTEKLSNTSFKIVHISDMHCDKKMRNEKKVVELINAIKPDIIVYTGDSLNTSAALPAFKNTMKNLKAKIAKLAVLGNFDVWYWSHLDLFGGTGFKVLGQQSFTANKNNEAIHFYGLNVEHASSYRQVLKNTSSAKFNILLYHYPDLIESLKNLNIDLYLAGHTHGGQVAIPFYGTITTLSKFGKKYEAGKYIVENTILYINRGIGMEGKMVPRVRFCARPEITVYNITPKNTPPNS